MYGLMLEWFRPGLTPRNPPGYRFLYRA